MTVEVTHAEILERLIKVETDLKTANDNLSKIADLIELQTTLRTGGKMVNWVAKVVGSAIGLIAIWKFGLAGALSVFAESRK